MWYLVNTVNGIFILPITKWFLYDDVVAGPFDEYWQAEQALLELDRTVSLEYYQ